MKENIKYQDWPESVKIATALSNKRFFIQNHSIPKVLGYFLLIVGILDLVFRVIQNSIADFSNVLNPLGFIIIGLFNLGSSNILKWIAKNSSWEERFDNTSTTTHKILSLSSMLILLLCLYLIFMFD